MPDIITVGSTTITPTLILGYESARTGRTIVHDILGLAVPDVTLRPASLRTGTLQLGFASANAESASRAAEQALAGAATAALVSDLGTVEMTFVVPEGGRIGRALEDSTRAAWIVTVDYHEVA